MLLNDKKCWPAALRGSIINMQILLWPYLELFDVVGCDKQGDADGNEEDADNEESWQYGPRCEDRLPGH